MTQNRPTALELYYNGNYVGRWSRFDVFEYGGEIFAIHPQLDRVGEMNYILLSKQFN